MFTDYIINIENANFNTFEESYKKYKFDSKRNSYGKPLLHNKKVDKFALPTLVETVNKNEIFGDNLAFCQWF